MKVTIKDTQSGEVIYSRIKDSGTMNVIVSSLLVDNPAGTRFETVVENNGHSHTFRNDETLNVDGIIRKVEGITVRKTSVKAETAK